MKQKGKTYAVKQSDLLFTKMKNRLKLRAQLLKECATTVLRSLNVCLQNEKELNLKPQSAKAKGRNLQKWVRDRILQTFPHLTTDDVRSTSMGAGGEDVQLSTAARDVFPFNVECKSLAKVAVYNYYKQCQQHGKHQPVVFIKQNGDKPLAIIDADYFFSLL